MADAELRGLERRSREGGASSASYLIARLRTGELSRADLLLAAFLGDPAAVEACERLGLEPPDESDAELGRWLVVLSRWGLRTAVRAAAAVARCLLDGVDGADPRPRALVAALEAWTDAPGVATYAAVRRLHAECVPAGAGLSPRSSPGVACDVVRVAGQAVIEGCVFYAGNVCTFLWFWTGGEQARREREAALRARVREELLGWCLGPRALAPPVPCGSLAARVARGELAGERVVLAAYLGVRDARSALGAEAPAEVADPVAWVAGLVEWPGEVLLQVAWRIAARVLPLLELRQRSVLPGRAVKRLGALCEAPGSQSALREALGCLEGLLRLTRRASPTTRPAARALQHALSVPWVVNPFPSGEDEGVVSCSWYGENGVALDDEGWYLRVEGSDGSPVRRVDYRGEAGLSQREAQQRVLTNLARAALEAGVSEAALRATLRGEVGAWAVSAGAGRE